MSISSCAFAESPDFAQLIGFGYGLGAAALIVLAVWAIKRWRNQKPKPVAGPVKETGE